MDQEQVGNHPTTGREESENSRLDRKKLKSWQVRLIPGKHSRNTSWKVGMKVRAI